MQSVTITQITPEELGTLIENAIKKIIADQTTVPTAPEADQFLTVPQAAEYLTLSVPTIYGLIHKKEIPCMKRGKRVYFSKVELTNYLKEGRKKTVAETAREAKALKNKKGGSYA